MKKYILISIILLSMIFSFSGCWDSKEPEDLAVVIAFGIDYDPEKQNYIICAQIINPLTMAGGEGGGEEAGATSDYWNVTAEGYSIFEALTNIRKKTSRRFHYAHTQLEIFSERMVKTVGILPIMDALERSRETRPIILPVITDGDVVDILTRPMPLESVSTRGIERQLDITNIEVGGTVHQKARIFLTKLSTPGIEPVASYIEPITEEERQEEGEDKSPLIRGSGLAAFRKGKLAGFLDGKQTRGYNWITDRVESTFLNIELPDKNNEYATIRTASKKGTLEPVINNEGEPEINIEINARGLIVNVTDRINLKLENEIQKSLKRRLAQTVENNIKDSIERAKELESDIFGFGRSFYRKKHDEWKKMEDNWTEIFVDIPVNITVEADIRETGLINRPIKPR